MDKVSSGSDLSALIVDTFKSLSNDQRMAFLDELSDDELNTITYDWSIWARPKQYLPRGDWMYWLIMAGRGFGKTRTGAETVRLWKEQGVELFTFIGATPADVRDIMINGPAGIITISPPWDKPEYITTKRRLQWSNGAYALCYSGAAPDKIRGINSEKAWLDELPAWKYPQETFDMVVMGNRIGNNPQMIITTTPKNIEIMRNLNVDPLTLVTRGNTYENRDNLNPAFLHAVNQQYGGSRLGRQEIDGELLGDIQGALFKASIIERYRIHNANGWGILQDDGILPTETESLSKRIIAIDPSTTSKGTSDDTGIIVVGIKKLDKVEHAFILDDVTHVLIDEITKQKKKEQIKLSPNQWAKRAIKAYRDYKADVMVYEANQGGDVIRDLILSIDPSINIQSVHASENKLKRAEPISSLYEQGRVHHVGTFVHLENEMTEYDGTGNSPNRLDALVWGITYGLNIDTTRKQRVFRTGKLRMSTNRWQAQ